MPKARGRVRKPGASAEEDGAWAGPGSIVHRSLCGLECSMSADPNPLNQDWALG
jgi:hypothetical protein